MKRIFNKGITLVELVVTMVVLSIGLTGIFAVMLNVMRHSADPLLTHQATLIASKVMQLVLSKEYHANDSCNESKPTTFNKVCDYQGIQNATFADFFPSLGNKMDKVQSFKISIEIQPYQNVNTNHALLVTTIVKHDQLGEVHLSAIKTAISERNEKAARIYTY